MGREPAFPAYSMTFPEQNTFCVRMGAALRNLRAWRHAAPPTTGLGAVLMVGLGVVGCIFSPSSRTPPITVTTVPYDTLTDAMPDVAVSLYAPYHKASLGPDGRSKLTLSPPVRVHEKETGRVVEYRYSERGFGSWNAERDRQFHLFLLRTFFFHPGVFDDTAAETLPLDSLYARAHEHDAYTRAIDSA